MREESDNQAEREYYEKGVKNLMLKMDLSSLKHYVTWLKGQNVDVDAPIAALSGTESDRHLRAEIIKTLFQLSDKRLAKIQIAWAREVVESFKLEMSNMYRSTDVKAIEKGL